MRLTMKLSRLPIVALIAVMLSGCAASTQQAPDEIYDPFENVNRGIHEFNKTVDSLVLRPVSGVYGSVVPPEIRNMLDNSMTNLGQPRTFINHVLQGDGKDAGVTLSRFLINSTLGFAGLFDAAAEMGIFDRPTDFGETLASWDVPEGPYLELPLIGPSTVRDTVGMVVDLAIDPVNHMVTEEQAYYLFGLRALNLIGTRHEYDDLINALLYESADSYAAQRLSYMLNKRHAIAGEVNIDDLEDPYALD